MTKVPPIPIHTCDTLPPGVVVSDGTVFFNVGERSPEWVNSLAKTQAGCRMLCRIVEGLLKKGGVSVVSENQESGGGVEHE